MIFPGHINLCPVLVLLVGNFGIIFGAAKAHRAVPFYV
jgi:hypothetical protein